MLPKLLRTYNPNTYPYAEDHQRRKCRFAFAIPTKDGYTVQHYPVLCRDFLNDTLVWKAKKIVETIYGYKFRGKITKDKATLMMDNVGDIRKHIGILNKIEEELGLQPTKIIEVEEEVRKGDDPAIIIEGDAWWQKTTVQFSWWTHVLRLLSNTYPVNDDWSQYLEDWAGDYYHVFWKIPAAMREAPDNGVNGVSDQYINHLHCYNGWAAQLKTNNTSWTNYGEYLRGKLLAP